MIAPVRLRKRQIAQNEDKQEIETNRPQKRDPGTQVQEPANHEQQVYPEARVSHLPGIRVLSY